MGRDARLNPFGKEGNREPVVYEHRGRVLNIGDEVILNIQNPVFFRIVDIRPILDPGAPPNLMFIDVAATLTFTAVRQEKAKEFIRTRTVEEAGPHPFLKLPEGSHPEISEPPKIEDQ